MGTLVVNLPRRFVTAFKTGYICGLNGWGRQYCPYKRGEFHSMWIDGWSMGRQGREIVIVALDG